MAHTTIWQWIFLFIVFGIPAIICGIVVWMLVGAFRHGKLSLRPYLKLRKQIEEEGMRHDPDER